MRQEVYIDFKARVQGEVSADNAERCTVRQEFPGGVVEVERKNGKRFVASAWRRLSPSQVEALEGRSSTEGTDGKMDRKSRRAPAE